MSRLGLHHGRKPKHSSYIYSMWPVSGPLLGICVVSSFSRLCLVGDGGVVGCGRVNQRTPRISAWNGALLWQLLWFHSQSTLTSLNSLFLSSSPWGSKKGSE